MAAAAKKTAAVATPEKKKETVAQQRSRLRGAAVAWIVDQHRAEFNKKAEELHAAEGLTFNRRLTAEEQAERKLNALLEQNPGLRSKLASQLASDSGPVPDDFGTTPAVEQHEGSLELSGDLTQS
jgi:hypothetical protein